MKKYDVSLVLTPDTYSLFQDFLSVLKKQKSRDVYSIAVAKICQTCSKDFLDLTLSDVRHFFSSLDLKDTTKSSYFYCCHSFAAYAEGLVDSYVSPFTTFEFHKEQPDYVVSDFPPEETLYQLLRRAGQGTDLYLAILLALRLCLSVQELASLIPEHFFMDKDSRMFLSIVRKPGSPPTVLEVPRDMHDMVLCRQNRDSLLLNQQMKPITVRALQRRLSSLGTEWTWRKLRAFGTLLLLNSGVAELDVAKICGVTGRWMHRYRGILNTQDYSSVIASLQHLEH